MQRFDRPGEIPRLAQLRSPRAFDLGGRREKIVDKGANLGLRNRAEEMRDGLAVLERHHVRDRTYSVRGGDLLVLVGVQLRELEPPAVLRGELFENRFQHTAGTAPGSPEIDDYRCGFRGLDDLALESIICYVNGVHRQALPNEKS